MAWLDVEGDGQPDDKWRDVEAPAGESLFARVRRAAETPVTEYLPGGRLTSEQRPATMGAEAQFAAQASKLPGWGRCRGRRVSCRP